MHQRRTFYVILRKGHTPALKTKNSRKVSSPKGFITHHSLCRRKLMWKVGFIVIQGLCDGDCRNLRRGSRVSPSSSAAPNLLLPHPSLPGRFMALRWPLPLPKIKPAHWNLDLIQNMRDPTPTSHRVRSYSVQNLGSFPFCDKCDQFKVSFSMIPSKGDAWETFLRRR